MFNMLCQLSLRNSCWTQYACFELHLHSCMGQANIGHEVHAARIKQRMWDFTIALTNNGPTITARKQAGRKSAICNPSRHTLAFRVQFCNAIAPTTDMMHCTAWAQPHSGSMFGIEQCICFSMAGAGDQGCLSLAVSVAA